jgi:hypothetical protein
MKNTEHFFVKGQNIIVLVTHAFLQIVFKLILLLDRLMEIVVNKKMISLANLNIKNIQDLKNTKKYQKIDKEMKNKNIVILVADKLSISNIIHVDHVILVKKRNETNIMID